MIRRLGIEGILNGTNNRLKFSILCWKFFGGFSNSTICNKIRIYRKKYNAIKNEDEDLITIYNLIKIVIEDMDNTKFDIIDNLSFKTTKDLGLFDDYMAEYNYYEYDLRS